MKVAFFTLGCKVNQYETQEMSQILAQNGFKIVNAKEKADIYIINSCSVTAESDRKSRQAVRRYKKMNPNAIIVLTGCMSQANINSVSQLVEADIIMGNRNNISLLSNIKDFLNRRERIIDLEAHKKGEAFKGSGINSFDEHTRAFIKIQDGCDRFCSYCIIPYARGRSRSKPLEDIREEIKNLAENAYKEIVFVGINLSAYGRDIDLDLTQAVKAAQNTEGIERIRLGSLEPDHITDDMLTKLSEFDKFCPQFHISLQSGSDSVLKRMNRHYKAAEFQALAEKIRKIFPESSITTDIIIGFPGESDEEFAETVEFVKKLQFEKAHIFPYSVRPGTRAAEMENQISKQIKEERCALLTAICDKIRGEKLKSMQNKSYSVLFESRGENGIMGYTKSYMPVLTSDKAIKPGDIADIIITKCGESYCECEIVFNKN